MTNQSQQSNFDLIDRVGDRLKTERVARGYTISQVVNMLPVKISASTLSKLENNKDGVFDRMQLGTLAELADLYGVYLGDLFEVAGGPDTGDREVLELLKSYRGLPDKMRSTVRALCREMHSGLNVKVMQKEQSYECGSVLE